MAFVEPGVNRAADFFELAGEEVVCAFDNYEVLGRGQRREERFDVDTRAELIFAALNYQFWIRTTAQVRQIRVVHGNSQAD
jgi:hypothetical protein